MIDKYIEGLSRIYEHFLGIESFEDELRKEIFIQNSIKQLLSGFDYVTFDIIALLKFGTERVGKTLADLSEGKLNKKDVEFYETQAQKLIEYRKGLRAEFDNMSILLAKEEIDLYADTKLNDAFGKIKNFMNIAGEIPIVLGEIKENFTRFEDEGFTYFESKDVVESIPDEPIRNSVPNNIIQISEYIKYDINDGLLIDIQTGNEYRLGSEDRIRFMKTLVSNSKNGEYVNYLIFAEALNLRRYDDGGRYGQRIPTLTNNRIRETYKGIRRSLESQFGYNSMKSDFCGRARNGYRLPFLRGGYKTPKKPVSTL